MRFLGILWSPEIIELTTQNFGTTIRSHRHLLVNFYSPKCKYCKQFEPEYEKVAYALRKREPPVPVAKINATVEGTIAAEQGIDR